MGFAAENLETTHRIRKRPLPALALVRDEPMNRDDEAANAYFDHCMDLWVRWMGGKVAPKGYAALDSVCGRAKTNYMAGEDDSDIVYEKYDRKLAETVHACVESLMPHQRHAVYKARGLSHVWPFANLSETKSLSEGMILLRKLIDKRC